MQEIKVTVAGVAGRKFEMRYIEPTTGKKVRRTTGIDNTGKKSERTAAERAAAKWEAELREGRYHRPGTITWKAFRTKYEEEVLSGFAATTDDKVSTVFNTVERILAPRLLRDVTTERLSHLSATLRSNDRSENTIAGHLSHLRAALAWAVDIGYLTAIPKIIKPKRAKGGGAMMKGRPITGEEFDRMIAAVPRIVTERVNAEGTPAADSWKFYLRGLWFSGLRLEESLQLHWTCDDLLSVDLSKKRPMLRIPAALEKGNKDRLLPMAPEFATLLLAVPESERTGYVFNPIPQRAKGERISPVTVGHTVGLIGEKAGVKVNTTTVGEKVKVKFASAHDLRRSFGERWASKIMPQKLMELMRHESIDTTMKFYVGRNAQDTAELLWQVHDAAGHTSGHKAPAGENQQAEEPANSPRK